MDNFPIKDADDHPIEEKKFLTWKDLIMLFLVIGILFIGAVFLLTIISITEFSSDIGLGISSTNIILFSVIFEPIAILLGVISVIIIRKKATWSDLGFKPTTLRWILIALGIIILLIPVVSFISVGVQELLNRPIENPQLPYILSPDLTPIGMLVMIVFGGIFVPITEEILFRGILFQFLKDRWGVWIGLIISSILFGLLHGDITVAVGAGILGASMGWVFHRSGSLYNAITIHIFNNSFTLILIYFLVIFAPDLIDKLF